MAGAQRKNAVLSPQEKKIVAYHEMGHALVAALQSHSAPVTKITIVPRTSGALGYTMQVDEGEHSLMSRAELLNKIATLTGGRAAEELIFGADEVTTGASNDIEQATKLARAMITRYGMTDEFDMVALETVHQPVPGGRHLPGLRRRDRLPDRRAGGGHRQGRPPEGRRPAPGQPGQAPRAGRAIFWKRRPSPARSSWPC